MQEITRKQAIKYLKTTSSTCLTAWNCNHCIFKGKMDHIRRKAQCKEQSIKLAKLIILQGEK